MDTLVNAKCTWLLSLAIVGMSTESTNFLFHVSIRQHQSTLFRFFIFFVIFYWLLRYFSIKVEHFICWNPIIMIDTSTIYVYNATKSQFFPNSNELAFEFRFFSFEKRPYTLGYCIHLLNMNSNNNNNNNKRLNSHQIQSEPFLTSNNHEHLSLKIYYSTKMKRRRSQK